MREVRSFGAAQRLCVLDKAEINESSGIAASRTEQGVYYTHNDSGDAARFFRFDRTGKVTGEFSLDGVEAIDWEDMASARLNGRSFLYLGDVGDNSKKRKSVRVYRVEEPKGGSRAIERFDTIELSYPDGAHNCEAVMVHPKTGDLWLVSKVDQGRSQVFVGKMPQGSGKIDLAQVGTIEVGGTLPATQMITGGDISPDGKQVLLLTYTAAYEFEAPIDRFADWIRSKPKMIRTKIENQSEAVCFSRDGSTILATSEGVPCPVNAIPIVRTQVR